MAVFGTSLASGLVIIDLVIDSYKRFGEYCTNFEPRWQKIKFNKLCKVAIL